MPTLNWIGKDKVTHHHLDVPFRTLVPQAPYGDPSVAGENLVIHGDNLEALKALLPLYEGQVNVVYIDPPYNTGNEGWVYNDNVNDPKIKKWLGEVVGKEGEDLSRHDKWLCMIYPRLKLLQRLLRTDGVILVSIDDIEISNLKLVLDEVFGRANRIGTVVWRNVTDNNPTRVSVEHEYVVVYAKSISDTAPEWKSSDLAVKDRLLQIGQDFIDKYPNQEQRQEEYSKWFRDNKDQIWPFEDYKFIDEGGIYTGSRSVHNPGKEGYRYDVIHPITGRPCKQPLMGYRFPQETLNDLLSKGKVLFGATEEKLIELKLYAADYRSKLPSVVELDSRMGTNEIKSIFPESKRPFDFPKPSAFIEELLSFVAAEPTSLILDSFAGSGTTAHALLKLNKADGGHRRFVLIEREDYAETITAERIRRVIDGYGPNDKKIAGLGGGFTYATLGPTIFTVDGALNHEVELTALRQYIWYAETKTSMPPPADEHPDFLGSCRGVSYYFAYRPDEETVLDFAYLKSITYRDDQFVVYADCCAIEASFLKAKGVQFKKIPRDVLRY